MFTFTIPNGAALSESLEVSGDYVLHIQMPDAWTAANLTFLSSADGIRYENIYKEDGTEYTVTAAADRYITNLPNLSGIKFLQIRSGTSGTPVNQGGIRTILVHVQ